MSFDLSPLISLVTYHRKALPRSQGLSSSRHVEERPWERACVGCVIYLLVKRVLGICFVLRVSDYFRHGTLIKQLKNLSVRLHLILMHEMSCLSQKLTGKIVCIQFHLLFSLCLRSTSVGVTAAIMPGTSLRGDSFRKNTNLSVPDSCCKTMSPSCGRRDHPSNIYHKVSATKALQYCIDDQPSDKETGETNF